MRYQQLEPHVRRVQQNTSDSEVSAQQIDRAERFRALHFTGKPLLLPNVWDGMSAAACVAAGFEAIATTSCGIAWSLGYQDGERMSRAEMLAAIKRIVLVARDVPVTADIETGYAHNDAELAETIAAVIDAGAIGINLEDSLPGRHECLRSVEEAAHRIAVVRGACKDVPLFINARVDVYFTTNNDEAARGQAVLSRCKAYLAAGADCVFPIGLMDTHKLGILISELNAPVNAMQAQGQMTYEDLCAARVARVSTAATFALTSFDYLSRTARELLEPARFTAMRTEAVYPQMQKLFV